MTADEEPSRLEKNAPLIAGVAIALPTLLTYYPPMSDLPLHEAMVGVLKHFGDPAYFPKSIYTLNLGHPNQLFYFVSWLLSLVFDTRWAIKIVVAAAQLAIFHSGIKLADHLGRSRWGAMLLAPLALGFTYHWGLVANLIGYSAFLYSLPLIDRTVAKPTWPGVGKVCALFVGLFFAHESAYVIAAGVVLLFTLSLPFDRRLTPLRLLPALFAGVMITAHGQWLDRSFSARPGVVIVAPVWFPLKQKLTSIPVVIFGSHEWLERLLLLGLGLVALAAMIAIRAREASDEAPATTPFTRLQSFVHRFRFEALVLVYLGLYFSMPFNWRGITLMHERFLGPAWAILVLCAAPMQNRGPTPRLAKFAGAVLPLAVLLVSWPQFEDSSRAYRALDEVAAHIPSGKTTALCMVGAGPAAVRVYSAGPGPARVLGTRGGRVGMNLLMSPLAPVQIKPEVEWPEFELRTFWYGSRSIIPTYDLKRWEYVLGQARDERMRRAMIVAFRPEADLVAAQGEWLLFHSNSKTILPIDAPDDKPPANAETLIDRMLALVDSNFAAWQEQLQQARDIDPADAAEWKARKAEAARAWEAMKRGEGLPIDAGARP